MTNHTHHSHEWDDIGTCLFCNACNDPHCRDCARLARQECREKGTFLARLKSIVSGGWA